MGIRRTLSQRLRWLGAPPGKDWPTVPVRRSGASRIPSAITSAIILAESILGLPQLASAQSAAQKQAQCELSAIGATRSAVALQSIRTACNWLVVNEGSLLNESLRPFYLCLVQNLSGAQDDRAAGAIVSACRVANSR
jgi:hypothetical protein